MTTASAPARPRHVMIQPRPARSGAHPARSLTWFTVRRVYRGTLILAAVLAGYVVLEVLSFRATYPDAESRTSLAMFERAPVVRMLQGLPRGIDTAGGFTAWDGGWVMASLVAIWAVSLSTRLLRGEEDDDRVGLLLAAPLTARALVAIQIVTIGAACVVLSFAVTSAMMITGEDSRGALLFGLTLGGFAAMWAAAGAVGAQILDQRRRALSATFALFAAAYLARVLANSSDGRAGIGRFTPWGWLDRVEPFAARRVWWVAALWISAAVLGAVAVVLRGHRDTAGAFVALSDRRAAHLRGLGGPVAFAWRQNRGVLLSWAIGLGAWAWVVGGLLGSMLDFMAADEAYQRVLDAMGLSELLTPAGFVGMLSVLMGVGFSLYAAWRVAAARTEEGTGRLDAVLARPVTRHRWLLGHLGITVVAIALLAVVTGTATWLGALLTDSDLALWSSLSSTLNQIPVALLFVGVATLVLGVAPRLTLVLPAALVGAGYVVELIGPALEWPSWVMNLSPFHHLALVPAESFLVIPALALVSLAVLAAAIGVVAFDRRDLVAD